MRLKHIRDSVRGIQSSTNSPNPNPKASSVMHSHKMKNLMYVAILVYFFQVSFLQTNANVIAPTCLKTPKPDLCVSSLKSFPESSGADVKNLALIMSDKVLKGKAQEAQKIINDMIKQTPVGSKQALLACADYYGVIIEFHIELQAHDGIIGVKLPRSAAVTAMDDIVGFVKMCNDGLGSSSSSALKVTSAGVVDLAAITKAIVQILP